MLPMGILWQTYGLVVAAPTVAIRRASVTARGVAPRASIHFSSGKSILSRRNCNRRKYPCHWDEGFQAQSAVQRRDWRLLG
jgi:hypothetical protein